jgi:signal transduction histidine kinase
VAIGMASGGLLTHQYLRLRNQTAGLQRLTVKLADRTASIARQRAQLRAQNERLNTFASFVSHDLRNPLTVAMARLELARETGEEEHLLATERAHARMEQLITDMLDLARHGRTIETPQSVAFESVVESAWDTVHTDGVSLRVDADVHILTDPARLRQLFENLFRNAIDHGGPGLTTVCVGTSEGNGFYVEDDGRGIAADDRDDVFDVQHSTTSEGTGYGLAIVKAIADAHTWTVTVTEGQRGGARFEVVDVTLGAD